VWCAIIGILTGLSLLSAFVGLLIVLPVIGHASWHLYRRALADSPSVVAKDADTIEVGQRIV